MRTALKILLVPAAAAAGGLFCIAPKKASAELTAPFLGRNFAHRGLHTEDQSVPENSLAAFAAAAEKGYGVELDVHMTADEQIVVFHDDTLLRLCGDDRIIEALTLEDLSHYQLAGTEERIPLLSDVFDTMGGLPVVLELKRRLDHLGPLLCEKTLDLIRKYPGPVCVQSFDPTLVRWFKKHAPDLLRGQLSEQTCHLSDDVSPPVAFMLSHCLTNFLCRPNFISYRIGKKPLSVKLSEKMGAMKVAWTSHSENTEKTSDTVIFEYYLPKIRFK